MLQLSSMGRISRRARQSVLPACTPMFVALALALPGLAHAVGPLPSGGHFVAGAGSINGNATSLTINQTSSNGIIDWNSFSIGNGNRVSIVNGSGATLNRVTGGTPSSILGALSATGSVYLINPQGIVIGASGLVSTGGRFVASTLDIDNAAFMKGGALPLSGTSSGTVVNLGKIASSGGDVFLIARDNVTNLGAIRAPRGTAELAAGQSVLLQDSSTSKQVFVQTGSHGTVFNRGTIEAAQISLQAADGNVFALAGDHTAVRATGTATREGHVWLVAETGNVMLGGTIDAHDVNGSGGTVDTSAAKFRIVDDPTAITTVKAGKWNITTPAFTIDSAVAPVFQSSLSNGTSINLQTAGGHGASGDIDVASSVHWAGAASLTLGAYHSLTIEAAASLRNSGSGNLTLRADSTAIDNGGSVTNNGTIDWSTSKGIVSAFYDMNGTYAPGKLLANKAWASPAYSGLRTQITGYALVNSLADLKHVSANLAGNYALGKDIDASATSDGSYVPIGSGNTAFTGQFDGRGHTIRSLTLHGETGYDNPVTLGLFGTIGATAIVRDLNVNASVSVTDSGQFKSGLLGVQGFLAANNYGTVLRVATSGSLNDLSAGVWYDGTTAGGLVGVNHGTIERSSSSVDSFTGAKMGGLVGENDGVIAQSYATGTVHTTDMVGGAATTSGVSGGLVAINNGRIVQSYATGAVTAECETYACGAGGLVNTNNGTIIQSFATGLVTGNLDPNTGNTVNNGVATINSGKIGHDVYWNKDTTGSSAGVTSGTPLPASNGLTTAQMSNAANFSGWDFSSNGAWAMPAGADHPVLRWQLEQPSSN